MNQRVFPVVTKSKQGNYYNGSLMVDGAYVPGLIATGRNAQECRERLILKWSRRLAQDAHVQELKERMDVEVVEDGAAQPVSQENDIIEIKEEDTK